MTFEENPWPAGVLDAARECFGRIGQRTFRSLDIRVQHAMKVWRGRYEMNPDQSRYAALLLIRCFRVPDDVEKPIAFVCSRLDQVVHHETVHLGFMKRAAPLVDISDQLADLEAHYGNP